MSAIEFYSACQWDIGQTNGDDYENKDQQLYFILLS